MSTDAIDVFNAALALPKAPPEELYADAADVAQQIVERIAQYDCGELELIEHDEAMRRVRAALAARNET